MKGDSRIKPLILRQVLRLHARHQRNHRPPEGTEEQNVHDVLDLGLVGDGGLSSELRNFMHSLQRDSSASHAVCATEKATCAKKLLELSTLLG